MTCSTSPNKSGAAPGLEPRLPASHVHWIIISGHHLYARNWAGSCRISTEPYLVSALLKLPFHEGSCKILVIRQRIERLQFAIGGMGAEDSEVEKTEWRERWSLWEVTSELGQKGWEE